MKINSFLNIAALIGLAVVLPLSGLAQTVPNPSVSAQESAQMQGASSELSEAEVRKIDKENKKITLKHGEIKNLDMPSMTMVFRVSDPAMLDKVKPGDKVRFNASNVAGQLTVTEIRAVK